MTKFGLQVVVAGNVEATQRLAELFVGGRLLWRGRVNMNEQRQAAR